MESRERGGGGALQERCNPDRRIHPGFRKIEERLVELAKSIEHTTCAMRKQIAPEQSFGEEVKNARLAISAITAKSLERKGAVRRLRKAQRRKAKRKNDSMLKDIVAGRKPPGHAPVSMYVDGELTSNRCAWR